MHYGNDLPAVLSAVPASSQSVSWAKYLTKQFAIIQTCRVNWQVNVWWAISIVDEISVIEDLEWRMQT